MQRENEIKTYLYLVVLLIIGSKKALYKNKGLRSLVLITIAECRSKVQTPGRNGNKRKLWSKFKDF